MGVSKVEYFGETLVDLSEDSVTPETLFVGSTAHDASVEPILGSYFPQNDIPIGTIVIWSGAIDAVPEGWHLCDGTEGTPDLRGRFVLGAGSEKYGVGTVGGEEEHTLTVDEMPKHKHLFYGFAEVSDGAGTYQVAGNHVHEDESGRTDGTGIAGSDEPHNNMPPYYALCYIMKVSDKESIPESTMNEIVDAVLEVLPRWEGGSY